jgi:hypothetical protein
MNAQARLFLDRLVCYLAAQSPITEEDLRAAGERVLADDRRLVTKIVQRDAFKNEAAKHLATHVFDRIASIKAPSPVVKPRLTTAAERLRQLGSGTAA